MKCCYISDLHIKYFDHQFQQIPQCDVLILAGDIFEHSLLAQQCFLEWATRATTILFVMGNHEYWGHSSMGAAEQRYDDIIASCNHILQHPRIFRLGHHVVGNYNFIGSTLWTEMLNRDGSFANDVITITDNCLIRDYAGNPLTPLYTKTIHKQHLLYIDSKLDDTKINIVITHHAPSWKQIDMRYAGSDINHLFMSNLDDWIRDRNIHTWVHGHLHNGTTNQIGSTIVTSNPRGHNDRRTGLPENPKFNPSKSLKL